MLALQLRVGDDRGSSATGFGRGRRRLGLPRSHATTAVVAGQAACGHHIEYRGAMSALAPVQPSLRIVRMSGKALTAGIDHDIVEGIPVLITTPARNVVDCFNFRNKIGLDVGLEALPYPRRRRNRRDARLLRVANVLHPYLEATG